MLARYVPRRVYVKKLLCVLIIICIFCICSRFLCSDADNSDHDRTGESEKKTFCPAGFKDNTEDIMCKTPIQFDYRYKNPCWHSSGGLFCLPYFMLIGMQKCGTSDLFKSLCKHDEIVPPKGRYNKIKPGKEIHFFDSPTPYTFEDDIISRKMRFSEYVEYFSPASSEVSKGRVNVITEIKIRSTEEV